MIQRYGTVNKAGEKIQRRYVKKALPEGLSVSFHGLRPPVLTRSSMNVHCRRPPALSSICRTACRRPAQHHLRRPGRLFLDVQTRSAILRKQVVYPYARTREIVALLEEHITENIVKIGNEYYRQVVGIPQGSVLSAILCSFFYGDLERRVYKFTEDADCVRASLFVVHRAVSFC